MVNSERRMGKRRLSPFATRHSLFALLLTVYACAPAEASGRGGPPREAGEFASPSAAGATPWLAEAVRWVGSGKFTHLPGPWCADAVSAWLSAAGRPPLASRMAASALGYGPRLSGPRVGALAVIHTRRSLAGHVGFVEGIEPDGSIALISGNWGHRVARSIVARGNIVAFVEVR